MKVTQDWPPGASSTQNTAGARSGPLAWRAPEKAARSCPAPGPRARNTAFPAAGPRMDRERPADGADFIP